MSEQEMQLMFGKKLDKDGDIGFEEFKKLIRYQN